MKVKVKSLSHVPLCDSMDCSPPGSSVHGILQARVLEWFPFPSPGGLPDPGTELGSPALQADALPSEPQGSHYPQRWGNRSYQIQGNYLFTHRTRLPSNRLGY